MDADEAFDAFDFFGFDVFVCFAVGAEWLFRIAMVAAVIHCDVWEQFCDVFGECCFSYAGRAHDEDVACHEERALCLLFRACLSDDILEYVFFEEDFFEMFHASILYAGNIKRYLFFRWPRQILLYTTN